MKYVKSLDMFGVNAKEIPCDVGKGAPTTSTVGAVGSFYMDEDTGHIYKCVAVGSNSYTWEVLESGTSTSTSIQIITWEAGD